MAEILFQIDKLYQPRDQESSINHKQYKCKENHNCFHHSQSDGKLNIKKHWENKESLHRDILEADFSS